MARRGFIPIANPRQPNSPVVSDALTGSRTPLPNPYTPPVPSIVFDNTGQVRNLGACLTALKACTDSLTGQRGDLPNRAVTFKDLVDFGVLSPNAVRSSAGTSVGGSGGVGAVGPPGPAGTPGWNVITSPVPPTSVVNGLGWFNSAEAQLYFWYDDGSSAQWVPASNQPGPQGPAGIGSGPPGPPGVSIVTSDTPPTLTGGAAWWNSAEGQLYVGYADANSTQWVRATNVEPGPAGPQGPAGSASSTITSIIAGTGLVGGGSTGDITLALGSPVPVALGGTGSTTASGALTNLGAASASSLGNYLPLTGGTVSGAVTFNGTVAFNGVTTPAWLPLTGGTISGGLTVTGAIGAASYWTAGVKLLDYSSGYTHLFGGDGSIAIHASGDNFYDATTHHFRRKGDNYESVLIYASRVYDPVLLQTPGNNCRITYLCSGVRQWSLGAEGTGNFSLYDDTRGTWCWYVGTNGSFNVNGTIGSGTITSSGTVQGGYVVSTGDVHANSSVTAAGNVTAGNDSYAASVFRGSVHRGAKIECPGWDYDWVSPFVSGGYLYMTPDYSGGPYYANAGWWSDARLKTNIRDTEVDALAAIMATPVRAFDYTEFGQSLQPWVKETGAELGLVAQELQKTIPLAVQESAWEHKSLFIDLNFVTPYLFRAIQQLAARLEAAGL